MNVRSQQLLEKLQAAFVAEFAEPPKHLIQAPGRVNLIGEHTDYNDGFVLPCAIDYQAMVAASPRQDSLVRVVSVDYGNQLNQFDLAEEIRFDHDCMWANYVRGVLSTLQLRGFQFSGADIAISGNVPQGAGLSSSAALEVVVGQTFNLLYGLGISSQDIALIGQQAENQFVGCNCGIMDQLISAQGKQGHALLIDCRSLQTKPVPMPEQLAVMIINSNKQRGLVDSEYNTRREQCETAAQVMGLSKLRDADLTLLEQYQTQLEPVVYQRARHVITENARTEAAAEALAKQDIASLSRLMAQSHASMRDDFAITVPEIDYLVELVAEQLGERGGVRMTGGGFGGCVVALVPHPLVKSVSAAIEQHYQNKTGLQASIYLCRAEQGVGELA